MIRNGIIRGLLALVAFGFFVSCQPSGSNPSGGFAPETIFAEIKKFKPEFEMEYDVDPLKQSIADSWPDRLDDSAAREEWDWQPKFDITAMTQDMLEQLSLRMN